MAATTIDLRPGRSRPHTRFGWLDSHHSFSFGRHQDPGNTGHGLLLVNNDDIVLPGSGFETHPHRDMEIVTWVLSGRLEHKDTLGNRGELYPGLAQRMSAGRGIWHSEINPSAAEPVHFVQMWVPPDTRSIDPGYQQLDLNSELDAGGLVPVASGRGHESAIAIHQRNAVFSVGRLGPGEVVVVPDDRHVHVFVATGAAELEGAGRMGPGDAARLTAAGDLRVTAGRDGAEILVWQTA